MKQMNLKNRACGILFCYNEEQIIGETLKHYLKQGIDIVVIDNYSTDSSLDIAKTMRDKYSGKVLDIVRVKTEGYEWRKILQTACEYMHKNLNHYEWILLIDADAFYYSPVRDMSLLEFMDAVKKYRYNIIDGKVYEFFPIQKEAIPLLKMKYYDTSDDLIERQHKIFLYHPTIDFYTASGHQCYRSNRRVCSKVRFIYKHYPWISYEHGLKKIFKERKPRYVEMKEHPTWYEKWVGMLPIEKDFIKDPAKLHYYREKLLSPAQFSKIMRFRFLNLKCLRIFKLLGYIHLPTSSLIFELKKDIKFLKRSKSFIPSLKKLVMSYRAIVRQEPCTIGFPTVYYFLMTNYCNARCYFCNQKVFKKKSEITLEKFKTMISHIPTDSAKVFCFNGGGEPLLCPDLFSIIKYVNDRFPWIDVHIRTNGLLIRKYAKELAELNISHLEMSIHGLEETNDKIIQRKGTEETFHAITLVNNYLKLFHRKLYKLFYTCVSDINIREVPKLIRKAAELKVNGYDVGFCGYYKQSKDCLFYHKELYNDTIRQSKKLARSLHIRFRYEPLFSPFKEEPCRQPWRVTVVDWDGNVYPCTGGEVCFEEKVKSGKYYFGNLLKEDLYKSWSNDSYVMIRRTCKGNNFIEECKDCHNAICLKGPDDIKRHIH